MGKQKARITWGTKRYNVNDFSEYFILNSRQINKMNLQDLKSKVKIYETID